MTFCDYDHEDTVSIAQSCKYLKTKSSAGKGRGYSESISCGICSNWDGSRCRRKIFDNMLSVPDLD